MLTELSQDRLWKHTHPEYYVNEYNYTVNNVEDWHEHAGESLMLPRVLSSAH